MSKSKQQQTAAIKLAQPDDTMPYCIKLQISAADYHSLVEHFSQPEAQRMGKPLVAVNKVFSAYGWEENLKACAAARDKQIAQRNASRDRQLDLMSKLPNRR